MSHELWKKLGHGYPVTRREFLASGLAQSLVFAFGSSTALRLGFATESPCTSMAPTPPRYVMFYVDEAGGSAFWGEAIPRTAKSELLPHLSTLGLGETIWSASRAGSVDTRFGLPFADRGENGARVSQLLQGLLERGERPDCPPSLRNALARTSAAGICYVSQDDSDANQTNPASLFAQRFTGRLFSGAPAMKRTHSGGNSKGLAVFEQGHLKSITIEDALSPGRTMSFGPVGAALSAAQRRALATAVRRLNEGELRRIARMPESDVLLNILGCGTARLELSAESDPSRFNPLIDPDYQLAFNLNENSSPSGLNARIATVAKLVIEGYAPPIGVICLTGRDVHDGTPIAQDRCAHEAGQVLSSLLQICELKNIGCLIVKGSDGSAGTINRADGQGGKALNTRNWTNDQGHTSGALVLHLGENRMRKSQLGHFVGTASQQLAVIDPDLKSLERLPWLYALNFALASNDSAWISSMVDQGVFTPAQVERLSLFSEET